MRDDPIAELRAKAEAVRDAGEKAHTQCDCCASGGYRSNCDCNIRRFEDYATTHGPLVAKALLLALDEVESLGEIHNRNNTYFKTQLAALVKEKADASRK